MSVGTRVVDVLDRMAPEHEFEHVRGLGWAGATNGKLQADAHDEGFEAMITGDMNMEFQTPRPPMPVVVIPTNRSFGDVSRYLAEVAEKLDGSLSAGYCRIAPHEGTPEWRKLQLEIRQAQESTQADETQAVPVAACHRKIAQPTRSNHERKCGWACSTRFGKR